MQIGAREAGAGGAGAALVDRPLVGLVARIAQAQVTEAGEQMAVARVAGGHHAIEHVDAGGDTVEQVLGCSDAHQVARLVRGHLRRDMLQHAQHLGLRLADAQAADRIAGQFERSEPSERLIAQMLVHAALHDAEQRVRIFAALELVATALRPAQAQLHRHARFVFSRQVTLRFVRRAFVELHHDVAVEQPLDLHAQLGREEQLVAVDG